MSDFNELNLKIKVNNLEDSNNTNSELKKQDAEVNSKPNSSQSVDEKN